MAFIGGYLRSFCGIYARFSHDHTLISLAIGAILLATVLTLTIIGLGPTKDYVSSDALALIAPRRSFFLPQLIIGSVLSTDITSNSVLTPTSVEYTFTVDFGTTMPIDRRFFQLMADLSVGIQDFETTGDCTLRPKKLQDTIWHTAAFDAASAPQGFPRYRLGDALLHWPAPTKADPDAKISAINGPMCLFDNDVTKLADTADADIARRVSAAAIPGGLDTVCGSVQSSAGAWTLTDFMADPVFDTNGNLVAAGGVVLRMRVAAAPSCMAAVDQMKATPPVINPDGTVQPFYVNFFPEQPTDPDADALAPSPAATSAFALAVMAAIDKNTLLLDRDGNANSALQAFTVAGRGDETLWALIAEHTLESGNPLWGLLPLGLVTLVFTHINVPCLLTRRDDNGGLSGFRLLFTRTRICLAGAALGLEWLAAAAGVAMTAVTRPVHAETGAWAGAYVGAAIVCQGVLALCSHIPPAGASYGVTGHDEAAAAGAVAYDATKGSRAAKRQARAKAIELALGDGVGRAPGAAGLNPASTGTVGGSDDSLLGGGTSTGGGADTSGSEVDTRRHPRVLLVKALRTAMMPFALTAAVVGLSGFAMGFLAGTGVAAAIGAAAGWAAVSGLALLFFVYTPLLAVHLRRVASSRCEFLWFLHPIQAAIRAQADATAGIRHYRWSLGRLCKKLAELVSFPPFAIAAALVALGFTIAGGVLFAARVRTTPGDFLPEDHTHADAWRNAEQFEMTRIRPHSGLPARLVNIFSVPTLNVLPESFTLVNVIMDSLIGHLSLHDYYNPIAQIPQSLIAEDLPSLHVEQQMLDAQKSFVLGSGRGLGTPVRPLPGTDTTDRFASPWDAFKNFAATVDLTTAGIAAEEDSITPPRPSPSPVAPSTPWPVYNSTFSTIVDVWELFLDDAAAKPFEDDPVSGARTLFGATVPAVPSICDVVGDFFGENNVVFGFVHPINDFVDACRAGAPSLDRLLAGTPAFSAIPFRAGATKRGWAPELSKAAVKGRTLHHNIMMMMRGLTELVEEVGRLASPAIVEALNRGRLDGANGSPAGRAVFSEKSINYFASTFAAPGAPWAVTTFTWAGLPDQLASELDARAATDAAVVVGVSAVALWLVGLCTVEMVSATISTVAFVAIVLSGAAAGAAAGVNLSYPRAVGCCLAMVAVVGHITHLIAEFAEQNPRLDPRYRVAAAMARAGPTAMGALIASALAPVGAALASPHGVRSAYGAFGCVHGAAAFFVFIIIPGALALAMPSSFEATEFITETRARMKEKLQQHKTALRVHLGPEVEALADAIVAREAAAGANEDKLREAAADIGLDAGSVDMLLTEASDAGSTMDGAASQPANAPSGIRMRRGASSGFTLRLATDEELRSLQSGSDNSDLSLATPRAPSTPPKRVRVRRRVGSSVPDEPEHKHEVDDLTTGSAPEPCTPALSSATDSSDLSVLPSSEF